MLNILPVIILIFVFVCIVVVVESHVFAKVIRTKAKRRKIAMAVGTLLLALFAGSNIFPDEPKPEVQGVNIANDQLVSSRISAKVLKVVDGDTVSVELNGEAETIRIIGINTPETVDPRKPVECYGKEASDRAKALLTDKTVLLEADVTQGERDKYGRLLRYVFFDDGSDFGEQTIRDGYAFEYTYSTVYKYQKDYQTAQKEAESAKRGLWADQACN